MSECCSACNQVILETQERVKCAGPCGEVFHETCAREKEYRKTLGVPKDVNGGEKTFRLQLQSSPASVVTTDVLNQKLDFFKQQLINEFRGFVETFKCKSEISMSEDTDITQIKKELSELRVQNEALRTQNNALVKHVKALEVNVDCDNKMIDELKKMLRNLSRDVDKVNDSVVELKDGLRYVRNINESLESENAALTVQVRELEVKVDGLDRSLKNLIEKNEVATKVVATAPRKGENQLMSLPNLPLLPLVSDNRALATTSGSKPGNFGLGNSPVTALAGIGPAYGGRLIQRGYFTVAHVYEQFLALNKNKFLFQNWLKSVCGANARWSEQCYYDLARMG